MPRRISVLLLLAAICAGCGWIRPTWEPDGNGITHNYSTYGISAYPTACSEMSDGFDCIGVDFTSGSADELPKERQVLWDKSSHVGPDGKPTPLLEIWSGPHKLSGVPAAEYESSDPAFIAKHLKPFAHTTHTFKIVYVIDGMQRTDVFVYRIFTTVRKPPKSCAWIC